MVTTLATWWKLAAVSSLIFLLNPLTLTPLSTCSPRLKRSSKAFAPKPWTTSPPPSVTPLKPSPLKTSLTHSTTVAMMWTSEAWKC